MKRSVLTVLAVVLVLAAIVTGTYFWIKSKQSEIQQTRDQRAAQIQRINARFLERQPGIELLDKELDSHCGRVIYKLEYRDAMGVEHKRYFDIESGQPMEASWLENCLKLPEAPPAS